MGISGLLPCLKSIATNINVKEYEGHRVAVDAYCWLHKGAYACSYELCQNIPTTKYINYCLHRVNLLRHNNITPVLVFDGGALPNKRLQEEKRRARRQEHRAKAITYQRQGNRAAANDCFKKAVDITPKMAHKLIKALQQEGIEYIVAPYEADAQLAFLAHTGYVHAIITEDSDLLPYGCSRVLFKMDQWGNGQEISLKNLAMNTTLNFDSWTMEMFRNMCILSGCDYLPSIPGLGLKKAYTLLNKYKNMDRVFRYIRADRNLILPPDYIDGFTRAEQTFLHQRVFDHINKKLVPLTPFPDHIDEGNMEFLGPLIPDDVALRIAIGEIDPYTHQYFEEPAPQPTLRTGPPASVPTAATRGRHFSGLRRSLSRPLLLPPQKNVISNYFTPTSKRTLKPFAPPRSSSQEDSKDDDEEAEDVGDSGSASCPLSPAPPSDGDMPIPTLDGYISSPFDNIDCYAPIPQPCSPPTSSISQAQREILVARTPSPPRPIKRRRTETEISSGLKVVVTSRFFAAQETALGDVAACDTEQQAVPVVPGPVVPLTLSSEVVPLSPSASSSCTPLIDLTETTVSFSSPCTTTKRLSISPRQRTPTRAHTPSLLSFFQKQASRRNKLTLSDDGVEEVEAPKAITSPYFP